MSFPQSFIPDELTPDAASELLMHLSDCALSPGLAVWVRSVRGEVIECESQAPIFGGD